MSSACYSACLVAKKTLATLLLPLDKWTAMLWPNLALYFCMLLEPPERKHHLPVVQSPASLLC